MVLHLKSSSEPSLFLHQVILCVKAQILLLMIHFRKQICSQILNTAFSSGGGNCAFKLKTKKSQSRLQDVVRVLLLQP